MGLQWRMLGRTGWSVARRVCALCESGCGDRQEQESAYRLTRWSNSWLAQMVSEVLGFLGV